MKNSPDARRLDPVLCRLTDDSLAYAYLNYVMKLKQ
jgi:hypothetical protein